MKAPLQVLEIRCPDDESLEIVYNKRVVFTASHDVNGWQGMEDRKPARLDDQELVP